MRKINFRSAGGFPGQRRAASRVALLAAGILGATVGLFGSVGCGGGGGGGARTTGSASTVSKASGRAVVSVRWPERSATRGGRLVPQAAESIRVRVLQETTVVGESLLTRPTGTSSVTTTADFNLLPTGNLVFRAEAYPNADGTGVLQAQGEGTAPVAADFVTPVHLTLASTIDHVEIAPANPPTLLVGQTTTLTATAKNAAGEIVLTGPTTWQWYSLNSDVATVDASTGVVRAVGAGTATFEAKETESGKKTQITLQTSLGQPVQITTTPALFPAFDPKITDYIVPSGADANVSITVDGSSNSSVSVDGQASSSAPFTTQVNNLTAGQRFSIVVTSPSGTATYYVRRLPADFPFWTMQRTGTPQAEFYVFCPDLPAATGNYAMIVDNYGVPVWWLRPNFRLLDVQVLSNGNVGWMSWQSPFTGEEFTFAALRTQVFAPVPSLGGLMDGHEIQRLPNGNYVFIVNVNRSPVDLSAFGGSPTATVIDNVIEEVAPDGTLVWSWSSFDHLPISATPQRWWTQYLVQSDPTDPYHMNSVEPDGGDGYVVSFRHHDAVYRIDKGTGAITWKLGGTQIPQSLTFVGDAIGNFGGQHDARLLPDGTLTLHDNGTNLGRGPRGVRYNIDTANRTATLLEQITDSAVSASPFVGSACRLPGGDWVTDWGGNSLVSEFAANGTPIFRLRFNSAIYSYRAIPLPFGKVSRVDLRNGMDAQFPR